MLNPSESTRYPNLRQVLSERARSLARADGPQGFVVAYFTLGVSAWVALCAIAAFPFAALLLAIPAVLVALGLLKAFKKNPPANVVANRENLEVVKRMLACIEKNRLAEDISEANAELLEGCAIAYLQARSALDQWHPGHSQDVKARIDGGIAEAMDEAILAHRDALPQNPTALPMGVQLGKAADTFLFGKTVSGGAPLEPAFSRTRILADQLRDAAHTVEDAARELTGSAPVPPLRSPRLNDALSELRMMKQAEEELRQDLRGGA